MTLNTTLRSAIRLRCPPTMSWKIAQADETLLNVVRTQLKNIKVPGHGDRVRKTECVLSFDSPESPDGIFVNLSNFQGYGADFVGQDSSRTACKLYLNIRWKKIAKEAPPPEASDAPTKLAIGVEGGFNVEEEQFDYEKTNYLAIYPEMALIALPNNELPELVSMVVDGVLKASDLSADEAQVMAWEDKRVESKYARTLVQVDNGKKISPDPASWVCEDSGIKEGLWLNLSDGYIGSGRRQVGAKGEMSGGTGAALRHYQEQKALGNNFCLCVKLGTITPAGADVYSYAEDEDDMVEDPLLKEHLAHWGINMISMEKTEKSMAELQIDLNVKFDFDKICESGKQLQMLSGPGYVGLKNLGNSCYMNSVLQVLFALPELAERYLGNAASILSSAPAAGAAEDLNVQMAKLATALLTDRYCPKLGAGGELQPANVSPQMFKFLVGKGHAEFSTGNQQDAYEYLLHLLKQLERSERGAGLEATQRLFQITMEERTRDVQSGMVRYKEQVHGIALTLQIQMDKAVNIAEVSSYEERTAKRQKSNGSTGEGEEDKEEPVKLKVPLELCLDRYFAEGVVDDYTSPVTKQKGIAEKRHGIKIFPKYLVLHIARYVIGDDWRPKKLDCLVPAPELLDLSRYRSTGQQPGEELLPEDAAEAPAAAGPSPDASIVESLMGMGFGENAGKRAALAVSNAGVEAALEWAFQHNEDMDFNDPLPVVSGEPAGGGGVDPASVEMLMAMGFGKVHATKALSETGGNLERAGDWLMSRMDSLDTMEVDEPAPANPLAAPAKDHSPKYELVGFISHIGPNTGCGHYVCHIKKEGRWTLFNDSKVAVSEEPPLDHGFMYLYKSVE